MSEPPDKDFISKQNSDARKNPRRVAFVTRRTSPQVHTKDEEFVMTYPAAFFSVAVAVMVVTLVLVWISLLWDAPLEGIADPMHTPNPAKAPWYFLGLQELLHYFPPFVAGVLIPTLVIIALIIIPYFNINVEGEGFFLKNKRPRFWLFISALTAICVLLLWFEVAVSLIPTLLIGGLMIVAAFSSPESPHKFRRWLAMRPLSFWIMTWFLLQSIILTIIGTFFRGPGWSWIVPWRSI
jgi:hypothetical protein